MSDNVMSALQSMRDYFSSNKFTEFAIERGGCAYFNSNKSMCAIGCIVPDAENLQKTFGSNASFKNVHRQVSQTETANLTPLSESNAKFIKQFNDSEIKYLDRVQHIHDVIADKIDMDIVSFDEAKQEFLDYLDGKIEEMIA